MVKVIRNKLAEEVFFLVSFFVAIATSISMGVRLESIDWHVLITLFTLMGLTLTFEKYHLLDALALKILTYAKTTRQLSLLLIFITIFFAVWVTNDIALITMVPLTITIAKRTSFKPMNTIIFQTITANIGSSLTPFGNPQNLYLFNFYKISTLDFMGITMPFFVLGLLLVAIFIVTQTNEPIDFDLNQIVIKQKLKLSIYVCLFVLMVLGVLRVLPFEIMSIVCILILMLFENKLLLKVDYFLLATFFFCFIAIDNIVRIPFLYSVLTPLLTKPSDVLLTSFFASQFISNVPSAILLSGFTNHAQALLLGVSLGGLGTLVASLANLISYKFYMAYDKKSPYKRTFILINVVIAVVLLPFILWMVKIPLS